MDNYLPVKNCPSDVAFFAICPYKNAFKTVKKATQMKKTFCFDNCAGYSLQKKFGLRLI